MYLHVRGNRFGLLCPESMSVRGGKVSIIGGKGKGKGNDLGCYRETGLGTRNTRAEES